MQIFASYTYVYVSGCSPTGRKRKDENVAVTTRVLKHPLALVMNQRGRSNTTITISCVQNIQEG